MENNENKNTALNKTFRNNYKVLESSAFALYMNIFPRSVSCCFLLCDPDLWRAIGWKWKQTVCSSVLFFFNRPSIPGGAGRASPSSHISAAGSGLPHWLHHWKEDEEVCGSSCVVWWLLRVILFDCYAICDSIVRHGSGNAGGCFCMLLPTDVWRFQCGSDGGVQEDSQNDVLWGAVLVLANTDVILYGDLFCSEFRWNTDNNRSCSSCQCFSSVLHNVMFLSFFSHP